MSNKKDYKPNEWLMAGGLGKNQEKLYFIFLFWSLVSFVMKVIIIFNTPLGGEKLHSPEKILDSQFLAES